MHFYTSDRGGRIFLFVLLALIFAGGVLNHYWDADHWTSGLGIDLTGDLITILVGVLILDRFSEYRREQQWKNARLSALSELSNHLQDLKIFAEITFTESKGTKTGSFSTLKYPITTDVHLFEECEDAMHETVGHRGRDSQQLSTSLSAFYECIQGDLDQVQFVVIPRILQSSMDQSLVDDLFVYDATIRTFRRVYNRYSRAFILNSKTLLISAILAYNAAADLVGAGGHVYATIAKYWEPQSKEARRLQEISNTESRREASAEDLAKLWAEENGDNTSPV